MHRSCCTLGSSEPTRHTIWEQRYNEGRFGDFTKSPNGKRELLGVNEACGPSGRDWWGQDIVKGLGQEAGQGRGCSVPRGKEQVKGGYWKTPQNFGAGGAPSTAPCPKCPKVSAPLYQQIPSPAPAAAGVESPTPRGSWGSPMVASSALIRLLIIFFN